MKNPNKILQEVKFIIPIILGVIGLWAICKFVPSRNSNEKLTQYFFYFVCVWFSYASSKHWWKMVRDKNYEAKRLKWLEISLLDRCNHRIRYEFLIFIISAMVFLITILIISLTINFNNL